MPLRLVVSFRGVVYPDAEGGQRYLARALDLKKRAEALGATLCAWSAQTFSFDFDPEELEEAAALAVIALDGTPEERFSAGIADGEMSIVGEGSFAVLSWGSALVKAVALSRDARPGEAVIEPDLFTRREVELNLLDGMVVDRHKHRLLIRPDAAPSMMPPPPPAPPTRPVVAFPPESALSQAMVDGGRARRAPTVPPEARKEGVLGPFPGPLPAPTPLPKVYEGLAPVTERTPTAPESVRTLSPDVAALFAGPPWRRSPTMPELGEAPSEPLAQIAKRALLQGDLGALEQLIAQLRESGEHSELVERMTGLIALRRGATAEALRKLRAAADAAREATQQARARLAYGVALATAGRSEAALLEALEALARARAAADVQGERACALFLARLSAGAGHADAASAWAIVAARCAAAI